ncbi:HK97-gp10 family putative phage morphogenesis protein [Streptococcus sp. E29BA]|uniref:HK97-gp10 family putative phage morphogenesis protein n=1 Tax=Streptococcus sp. E29BA TaxID=3278716 RepID=UPI00359D4A25
MEFVDNSAKAKALIEKKAIQALIKACKLVEGQAVALAPAKSGALRDSIAYKVDEATLIGYVGTNVEYAIYMEFGTGEFAEKGDGRKGGWVYKAPDGKWYFTYGNKPKPYLRPAFRRNKKRIRAILEDALREIGD